MKVAYSSSWPAIVLDIESEHEDMEQKLAQLLCLFERTGLCLFQE